MSRSGYYEHLYESDIGYILKCINEVFPPYKFKSSAGWNNSLEEWHENTSEFGDVDIVITLYKQKITGVSIDVDVRYNHTLLECAYSGKWVDIHHLKRIKKI